MDRYQPLVELTLPREDLETKLNSVRYMRKVQIPRFLAFRLVDI